MSGKDSETDQDPEVVRDSLEKVVKKLEQTSKSSDSWDESIHSNPERWEYLKKQIQEKQRDLKQLVTAKKSGLIGTDEFQRRYSELQDELTRLEFEVYNMRLGTDVHL